MTLLYVDRAENTGDQAPDGNSTSCTVSYVGTPGNLLVASCQVRLNNGGFSAEPSGWTTYTINDSAELNLRVYTKIADGTAADNLSESWATERRAYMSVIEFSGDTNSLIAINQDLTNAATTTEESCVSGDITPGNPPGTVLTLVSLDDRRNTIVGNHEQIFYRSDGSTGRPTMGLWKEEYADTGVHNNAWSWVGTGGCRSIGVAMGFIGSGEPPAGSFEFTGNIADITATQDVAYSQSTSDQWTSSEPGDTITYELTAGTLPAGLTLDQNSGELSGTPTALESQTGIVITATSDLVGTSAASNAFSITVQEAQAPGEGSVRAVYPAWSDDSTEKGITVPVVGAISGNVLVLYAVMRRGGISQFTCPGWDILFEQIGSVAATSAMTGIIATRIADGSNDDAACYYALGSNARTYGLVVELEGCGLPTLTEAVDNTWIDNAFVGTSVNTPELQDAAASFALHALLVNTVSNWPDVTTDVGQMEHNRTGGTLAARPGVALASAPVSAATPTQAALSTAGAGGNTLLTATLMLPLTGSPPVGGIEFTGNIADQVEDVGTPVSLDLSPNWTGAVGDVNYTLSSGSLPAGLTLGAATGVITGTPTTPVNLTGIIITANDGGDIAASNAFDFRVWAQLAWDTIPTQQLEEGNPVNIELSQYVNGGDGGTYTYDTVTGQLPDGLVVDTNTGLINGTPSTTGSSSVSFDVVNRGNRAISNTVEFIVSPVGTITTTLDKVNMGIEVHPMTTLWYQPDTETLEKVDLGVTVYDMDTTVEIPEGPGAFAYSWLLNEGTGTVGACLEDPDFNATVSSWGSRINNNRVYPCNEGEGSILYDSLNQGTDATIQNFDPGIWQ